MNSGSSAFMRSGAHSVPAARRRRRRTSGRAASACRRAEPVWRTTSTVSTVLVPGIFSAASTLAFSGTFLPPRRPSSAVMISLLGQSATRSAMDCGAKPPNTTEWIAPTRAQAQHRHDRFGNHRQVDRDAVALAHAQRAQRVGELAHARMQFAIGDVLGRLGRIVLLEDQRGLVAARARWRSRQLTLALSSPSSYQRMRKSSSS